MVELILEVAGGQTGDLEGSGTPSRFAFGEFGGTIGRAAGGATHWVLPDGMVSGMHAAISCIGGTFHIEDRNSTNGVVLNSTRIPPGRPHPLRDGDVLRIDPYTIRATVMAMAHPRPALPKASPVEESAPTSGQILDQFSMIGPASPSSRERLGLNDIPAANDYVDTPDLVAPQRTDPPPSIAPRPIPRGYNPAESIYVKPSPEPIPSATPARAPQEPPVVPDEVRAGPQGRGRGVPVERSGTRNSGPIPPMRERDGALASVFAAAGLTDVPITPDLARELGTILRIVAQGLVDVLRTRRDVKSEFDVEGTIPGLEKNNPLKLAQDGTEALRALFAHRHPSFLEPVDAFRDSFDDLRKHHVAMSAGTRAAFEAMLAEFHPDRLEERFSRRASGAIVPLPARIRNWDLYRERFDDLVHGDPDDVFRRLFGDAFSEAYSAQLKAIESRRGDDHA
jgi:type VI secretion system FHA domain protein